MKFFLMPLLVIFSASFGTTKYDTAWTVSANALEIMVFRNDASGICTSSDPFTECLQFAVDALTPGGGRIKILGGTHIINNDSAGVKIIGVNNLSITGIGESTVLKYGSTKTKFYLALRNDSNLTISNLKFWGDIHSTYKSNSDYHQAVGTSGYTVGIRIQNCHFVGFKSGAIQINTGERWQIDNNIFRAVDSYVSGEGYYAGAIKINDGKEISIKGNQFSGLRYSGISMVSGPVSIDISNNSMLFDSASTIDQSRGINSTMGLQFSTIANNLIKYPSNEGILIQNANGVRSNDHNVISGNIIEARGSGICMNLSPSGSYINVRHNIIANNSIYGLLAGGDRVDFGIYLTHAQNTQVTNNSIYFATTGIYLIGSNSHFNSISGNHVDSVTTGIRINGEGTVTKNIVRRASTGIYAENSGNTSITDNQIIGASPMLSIQSSVDYFTDFQNCDGSNGACSGGYLAIEGMEINGDNPLTLRRGSGSQGKNSGLLLRDQAGNEKAAIGTEGILTNDLQILSTSAIVFHTNSNLVSSNAQVKIDGAGNFGIGTSPTQKLEVNGGIKVGAKSGYTATPGAGTIIWNDTTSKLQVYNGTVWTDCN